VSCMSHGNFFVFLAEVVCPWLELKLILVLALADDPDSSKRSGRRW
jgi:hypothetical protein